MIACIVSALIGFGTVIWYASGDLDEAEIEEEVKQKMEAKKAKKDRMRRFVGI
jgi:iron transport multicopper oxidase